VRGIDERPVNAEPATKRFPGKFLNFSLGRRQLVGLVEDRHDAYRLIAKM
jgi:hypothetical protein